MKTLTLLVVSGLLTSCTQPGFAVTYSGVYWATDGQEFSASAVYRPVLPAK